MKKYIPLILIFIGIIIFIVIYIYSLNNKKYNDHIDDFYGTWELVNNNYKDLGDYVNNNYSTNKKIIINKRNIDSEIMKTKGLLSCGFNIPKRDFAITNYNNKTMECSENVYLITTLNKLISQNNNREWQDIIICFTLNDNTLIQKDCNTDIPDVGIAYKKIK